MRKNCTVCNTNFETKRRSSLYCSDACRSRAYRLRHAVKRAAATRGLSPGDHKDVITLARYSSEAAETVVKVAALCGAELAREVLDGYWSLLVTFDALPA
jgi:glycerol-3-phosphate dehydrogenase